MIRINIVRPKYKPTKGWEIEMNNKVLRTRFQPESHDFRYFKPDIEAFYEAVRKNDRLTQEQLLHNSDGSGLADVYLQDYLTASIVNGNPLFTKTRWITYLSADLPSANRKWTNEEKTLIEALVCRVECAAIKDSEKHKATIEYLRTHLKETYKEHIQLIRSQKQKLIDLHKVEAIAIA